MPGCNAPVKNINLFFIELICYNGFCKCPIFAVVSFICVKTTKDTTFYLGDDPTNITELEEVIVTGKKTEQMKREISNYLQK